MSGFVATNVEYSSEVFKWLYSKAHYRCLQAVALDSYQTVFKQLSSGLHHRCWSACLKPFLSGLLAVASWWSRSECASEPFFLWLLPPTGGEAAWVVKISEWVSETIEFWSWPMLLFLSVYLIDSTFAFDTNSIHSWVLTFSTFCDF